MADTNITFETKFDSSGFEKGVKGINSQLDSMRRVVAKTADSTSEAFGSKSQGNIEKLSAKLSKQVDGVAKVSREVERLSSEYESLASGDVTPKSLESLTTRWNRFNNMFSKELKENDRLLQNFIDKESEVKLAEESQGMGLYTPENLAAAEEEKIKAEVDLGDSTEKLQELRDITEKIRDEMDRIRMNPDTSDEAQKLSGRLSNAKDNLATLSGEAAITEKSLKRAMDEKPVSRMNRDVSKMSKTVSRMPRQFNGVRKSVGSVSKAVSKLTKRITSIATAVLIFNVLRNAIRGAVDHFKDLSMGNEELASSLATLKFNLKAAFQPIFEAVLPALQSLVTWLATATKYVAQLTAALFGTTYEASKESVEALESQKEGYDKIGEAAKESAKKAKKAGKQLQGFDQLNKMKSEDNPSDNKPESGGPSGTKPPEIQDLDTSHFTDALDKIKRALKDFYEQWGMKDIFDGIRRGLDRIDFSNMLKSLKVIGKEWTSIGKVGVDALKRVSGATGELIGTSLEYLIATLGNIIDIFLEGFSLFSERKAPEIRKKIEEVADSLVNSIGNMRDSVEKIGEMILKTIDKYRDRAVESVSKYFEVGADSAMHVWDVVTDVFDGVSSRILEFVEDEDELLQDFFDNLADMFLGYMDTVTEVWADMLEKQKEFWDEYGQIMTDSMMDVTLDIVGWLLEAFNELLKPIWDRLLEDMKEAWDNSLGPMYESALDFVGELTRLQQVIWNDFISPVVDFLMSVLMPIFLFVFDMISGMAGAKTEQISGFIEGMLDSFKGFIKFLRGVFTGDWRAALEGIVEIGEGVMKSIVSTFRGPLNFVIDMFNGLIEGVLKGINYMSKAVNNMSFDIPDWVPGFGGTTFGIKLPMVNFSPIPNLPKLAKGGLIPPRKPRQVIVGDNMVEDEIVSPVSTMQRAMAEVLAANGGSGQDNYALLNVLNEIRDLLADGSVIEMDDREFGRAVQQAARDIRNQTGVSII